VKLLKGDEMEAGRNDFIFNSESIFMILTAVIKLL